MRDRIRLKNAHDLLIDSSLDQLLARPAAGSETRAQFEDWRSNEVSFLIVLADPDNDDVLHFVEAARDSGFVVRTFAPVADFAALENLRGDILREVRRGKGVLIGNGSQPLNLETFLGLLLVSLKKKSITPEEAVAFASGREEYRPEDKIIYEYKRHLDPAYEFPAHVTSGAAASEPTADEPVNGATDALPADLSDTEKGSPGPVESDADERPAADMLVESQANWEEAPAAGAEAPAPEAPASEAVPETISGPTSETITDRPGEDEESEMDSNAPAALTAPEPQEPPEPAPAMEETPAENEPATQPAPVAAAAPISTAPAPAAGSSSPANTPVAGANGANAPASQATGSGQFSASRFTIRVKLISLISGIIIFSLGMMIFLASYFFRNAMESGVQENNLVQATVIGSRVETELRSLETGARLLVTGGGGAALREQFFRSNPGIIFVGTAAPDPNGINIKRSIFNRTFLDENDLKPEDIARLHGLNGKYFLKSFNGATVFQNISPGFTIPVLGMSVMRSPGEEIILVYLDAENFLEVFNAGGADPGEKITQTFMVNSLGEVIAHPDPARVLSRSDMTGLVIVQELLKSAVEEGQKAYEDEDGTSFLGSYKKIGFAGLGIISTAEEERVLEPVYWIQTNNLLITVIVLALAILIVYYVAKSLSVPIVRLVGATQAIERGQYDMNIKPASGDEVGLLTDSFSRMAQGLGEREKLKDAMVKFVNKQIADLAMKGQIKLGGEQKNNVAVFFSDLRGFTAMSEKMTAEEVVSYLNEYFTGMVSCVNRTHGIVDKFIGDAVMAHWGAFESHGNDTENAINGALMMRTAIMEFNKRGGGNRPFAKQGCGINTGQLVSGQIGSEERFEFTVIGDTVNLASRIEALNKPFGTDILISQDSYDLVKDIFKFEPMPAIKVKGKEEPQVIYAVIGRRDDPNCPRDMEAVREMLGIEFDGGKEIDPDAKEEKFEVVG